MTFVVTRRIFKYASNTIILTFIQNEFRFLYFNYGIPISNNNLKHIFIFQDMSFLDNLDF